MKRLLPLIALGFLVASSVAASASVEVYLSPPQVQTADAAFTGILTEDFNTSPTGPVTTLASTAIGTYKTLAGTATIRANNQYGGYDQGNYLAVAVGGTTSVSLNTPESYFGIFYTAGEGPDTVTLYDSANAVLGSFTTQRLAAFLSTPTVTATNNAVYSSSAYKGQPTADGSAPTIDKNEYFAYLNFVVTSGNQIARVGFSKGSGGSFESDNHSVTTTAPNFANTPFVDLGQAPEPGAIATVILGAVIGGVAWVRRRPSGA